MFTNNISTQFTLLLITMFLFACSGQRPLNLGVQDNKLPACPKSPNCISSDADNESQRILPFQIKGASSEMWHLIKKSLLMLPRTKIITESPDYIHAECSSAIFGFVDDLELHLRPSNAIIAIRSASRLGYSDFGVNRKRIKTLRTMLYSQGIIK